jgi:hypothetical protein
MTTIRACAVGVIVVCLATFMRPDVFAARTAQTTGSGTDTPTVTLTDTSTATPTVTDTPTATPTPTDTPTAALLPSVTATESPIPTLVPIPTATRVPTATRTATPSPPVAEPMVSFTAFYARTSRGISNSVRVGAVTLSITLQAARKTTSPIQLGWSISNGQSILAHHQIHTHGWVGTRTFIWNHVFVSPGSYIGIGVVRFAGKTQVRAIALDVSK